MNGHVLTFAALWIGSVSICICEQDYSIQFDHAKVSRTSPEMIVQVYNWTSMPLQVLTAAEKEAARLFHAAGITALWVNCRVSFGEARANPICVAPCPPSRIAVRIIPEVPADRANRSLGVALSEGGIYATIFYPRVAEYAELRIATASQILGHAMAHEVGHLLLDNVPHARFGLMRGKWNAEDLRSMAMGDLGFSSQQSAMIRQAAMRRLRSRETSVLFSHFWPDQIHP